MAQRTTVIFGDQIDVSAAGLGLAKDTDDNFEVLVDDVTVEIVAITGIGDALQVKDGGITEPKLDSSNAPTDGYVLSWNAGAGQFEWIQVDVTDAVLEADVVVGEVPTESPGPGVLNFTIANTPVTGTVAVYLNGLRQLEGAGEDYTVSGTTVTFAKAPRPTAIIQFDYIIDN